MDHREFICNMMFLHDSIHVVEMEHSFHEIFVHCCVSLTMLELHETAEGPTSPVSRIFLQHGIWLHSFRVFLLMCSVPSLSFRLVRWC